MHQAGGGAQGYTTDVEIQYREMKRQQDMLHHILAKHTGQTAETISHDFERDRWMDAVMAKEYGFVDEIMGTPIFVETATENKETKA